MPSTETEIWLALKGRVQEAAGHIPVAWPAENYDAVAGVPFLQVANVTGKPERLSIAPGAHDRAGTLALVLAYPMGQAVEVSQECAGQIAAHFPDDLRLRFGSVCVRIESRPHVLEGFRDGSWWRTPINIFWRSFA